MQCNRTHSLNAFFGEMRREHPLQYVAVVGCGCSIATEPVAEVSHYYNIPMVGVGVYGSCHCLHSDM